MIRRQLIVMCLNIISVLILSPFFVFAEWIGPKEVVNGTWGKNIGQFYYEPQDTFDAFPKSFGVDKNNNVVISDEGNRRVYIYTQNGKLMNIVKKPSELSDVDFTFGSWPGEIILLPYSSLIVFSCDYKEVPGGYQPLKQCVIDYRGKIISKIEVAETFASTEGVFILKNDKYYHYSPSGELLKRYDIRPLELGVVKEQSLGNNKYKVTVTYPDKTWEMIQKWGACPGYKRDACGNLYCGTSRFNSEGEDLAPNEIIPKNKYEEVQNSANAEPRTKVIEEYGEAVLAPNGDIYAWKRTPDKYSILKWVWVDGPECPQYLDVTPTKNSLKFTWQKPTKDADKVTGYQLLQSYNICGPFKQAALLKKNQLSYEERDVKKGETYYYIVKAVRGSEYSGNSNKVCGQIE